VPTLRSWQVHHPAYWLDQQRQEYATDVTLNIAQALSVAVPLVGPSTAINMLLAISRQICTQHPDIIDSTLDTILGWAEDLSRTEHPRGQAH
jgi:hypothetical protein